MAGQGVSYVLLKNGQFAEFVDANYVTRSGFGVNPNPYNPTIAFNVTSLSAGTDQVGVNSVDYTVTVNGATSLYEWRDVTATSSLLATGVGAYSAGQHGLTAYVLGGTAYLHNDGTGQTVAVVNPSQPNGTVTSVALGVDASGGYQVEVLYSGGTAFEYDSTANTWTSLGSNVRAVSKTFDGVVRVLLTTSAAFEHSGLQSPFWNDSGDSAVA